MLSKLKALGTSVVNKVAAVLILVAVTLVIVGVTSKPEKLGQVRMPQYTQEQKEVIGDASISPFKLSQTSGYSLRVEGGKFIVTLTESIGDREGFTDLVRGLALLSKTDNVVFDIHNYGGRLDTGILVINAIHKTRAHTVMHVTGPSYSMAAVLACHGNELKIEPTAYLMYHMYLGNFAGSGADVRKNLDATDYIYHQVLKPCVDKGIITKAEEAAVFKGEEIYKYPLPIGNKK